MIAVLLLACPTWFPPQDPLGEVDLLRTKHYDLFLDMSAKRRDETARLVELAWTAYSKHLGAKPRTKPGERPVVRFFGNQSDWLSGMEYEQVFPLPGILFVHFSPERDTLYLHDERNVYHARKMLLYGLFLQFHYHLKAKNEYLGKEWFITGMADALSTHNWDGAKLELGAQRLFSDDNRAYLAIQRGVLDKLQDDELSPEDLSDWDVRWGLTAFLMFGEKGKYRKAFQKRALGSSGSMLMGHDFMAGVGDPKEILSEMDAWIRENARGLEIVQGLWEETSGAITGAAVAGQPFALATFDGGVSELQAEITSKDDVAVGFILDWADAEHYRVALYRDYAIRIWEITPTDMMEVEVLDLPETRRRPIRMRAEFDDQEVLLFDGKKELGRYPAPNRRLGLAVRDGRGSLEDLVWE